MVLLLRVHSGAKITHHRKERKHSEMQLLNVFIIVESDLRCFHLAFVDKHFLLSTFTSSAKPFMYESSQQCLVDFIYLKQGEKYLGYST